MKSIKKIVSLLLVLGSATLYTQAQSVSSLEINPDPRSMGMANSAIALDGNAFSIYRNTAALSFTSKSYAAAYSFTKWYGKNRLHTLGGYYQLNDRHTLAAGFRYYDGEKVNNTADGIAIQTVNPYDLMMDLGYAYRANDNFSVSTNLRYINSKVNEGEGVKKGNSFAMDLGLHYKWNDFNAGISLNGIGTKIDYGFDKFHMPLNLAAGVGYSLSLAEVHQFTGSLQGDYRFLPNDQNTFGAGAGLEYKYNSFLALRGGYRMGDKDKSPGNYGVIGCGIYYGGVTADFSYILAKHDSILRDVWQVSLGIAF